MLTVRGIFESGKPQKYRFFLGFSRKSCGVIFPWFIEGVKWFHYRSSSICGDCVWTCCLPCPPWCSSASGWASSYREYWGGPDSRGRWWRARARWRARRGQCWLEAETSATGWPDSPSLPSLRSVCGWSQDQEILHVSVVTTCMLMNPLFVCNNPKNIEQYKLGQK